MGAPMRLSSMWSWARQLVVIVHDRSELPYARALSAKLHALEVCSLMLVADASSLEGHRANSVVLIEVVGKASDALKAQATTLSRGARPVVLVRVNEAVSTERWSTLVPGVDPICESSAAMVNADPSENVVSHIMEMVRYLQSSRRLRLGTSATGVAAFISFAVAAALGLLASAAASGERKSEEEAQSAKADEVVAARKAHEAWESAQAITRDAQTATLAAQVAKAQAAAFAAQLAAILSVLRPQPSLEANAYSKTIEFRRSHSGSHYAVRPLLETLPQSVQRPSFTFYHGVGRCGSHVLEAIAGGEPRNVFEYDGYACYADVRALFLSADGTAAVAAKTTACTGVERPILCPSRIAQP